ncbi:hypothetical protein F2P56_006437 [Juglans regia]|uniref:Uncharacterized protein LOC109011283 n=2 Tax=Juglans regia TaxID=51240 RepID=A0A2I4GVM6_JUGRE|nr:uncharacterized protein LOC109011283 [Juglans regia]KAF5474547.1 hypothetical protein F2P56_006437 [Juglans regia]
MNQEEQKVLPGHLDPGTSENSSSSVNGVVPETMISVSSEEKESTCVGEAKNGVLNELGSELGSSKVLMDRLEHWVNQEVIDRCGGGEEPSRVDRGTSEDSSSLGGGVVSDTGIVINSDEALPVGGDDRGLGAKINELVSSKVPSKEVHKGVSESEKNSCVIDVKCSSGIGFGDNWDGERVCRICHLGSEQSSELDTGDSDMTTTTDLIQLGCGCKDELGIAHSYCAEAWFKLRGNRLCEICGKTAKNVKGAVHSRFMEEWNERRFTAGSSNSSGRGGGCWRGQPFCNFLMACLVIAFVLPWFFRVNMF